MFILTIIFILSSLILYILHFYLFHDLHHIILYFIGDIAFLPVETLLTAFVLHRLLEIRDKKEKLKKLNMVIGTFFSEAGNELIRDIFAMDNESGRIKPVLACNASWKDKNYQEAKVFASGYTGVIIYEAGNLKKLKAFLESKKGFLLSLLENPILLEHDTFTDLLWAVFHLAEELSYRKSLDGISGNDRDHINGDIKRVYSRLLGEWLLYMRHLQADYPYLFSLAVRLNPFNPDAKAEIE